MNILIIGCKLQGTEAIYLSKKAGYYVTAVDIDPNACGAELADKFVICDAAKKEEIMPVINQCGIVLPAIEDLGLCRLICRYGKEANVPVIFDEDAYEISSSKEHSNRLFDELGLAVPQNYPECGFPVIIKPDDASGSSMVFKAANEYEMQHYIKKYDKKPVIQKFLEGRSYSIEVLRIKENVIFPMITEVHMDSEYDCRQITAPANISKEEAIQMYNMASVLDSRLQSDGIFDIEVISDNGKLALLEIDARLPSQTPISVYHAGGLNMIKWLTECTLYGYSAEQVRKNKVCQYRQIKVTKNMIYNLGEHIMADCSHLKLTENFFGADEAITDYTENKNEFRAILIICAETYIEAEKKYNMVIDTIARNFFTEEYSYVKTCL